jgi:hypothetical protein
MADSLLRALGMAFAMGWEILWPLILGFVGGISFGGVVAFIFADLIVLPGSTSASVDRSDVASARPDLRV